METSGNIVADHVKIKKKLTEKKGYVWVYVKDKDYSHITNLIDQLTV